jgi:hypothetical protein
MGLFETERAWFATLDVDAMAKEMARNPHVERLARLRPLFEAKRQQPQSLQQQPHPPPASN